MADNYRVDPTTGAVIFTKSAGAIKLQQMESRIQTLENKINNLEKIVNKYIEKGE